MIGTFDAKDSTDAVREVSLYLNWLCGFKANEKRKFNAFLEQIGYVQIWNEQENDGFLQLKDITEFCLE